MTPYEKFEQQTKGTDLEKTAKDYKALADQAEKELTDRQTREFNDRFGAKDN
jgi:hypothetical protein